MRKAVRSAIGNTARRTAGSAATHGARQIAKRHAFRFISKLSLESRSLYSGSIISVSPNLYEQIQRYDAKEIWIDKYFENNFDLNLKNNSSQKRHAQLKYQLRDVDSGRIEIEEPCGMLSMGPNDNFNFSFSISDLPYLGAKQLYATSNSSTL